MINLPGMAMGVIFDFNGTLLWDTELHNRAWDFFLHRYGVYLSDEEKQLKLHGRNNAQLIAELFPRDIKPQEAAELAREKELHYQQLVMDSALTLADGAIELFETLKSAKVAFTIVTASDAINVDFFFRHYALDKWFDREKVVFSDGSVRPKPFPDMCLKAMRLLGLLPEETIIFEDSDTGLLAARRSNAGKIIIVNSTGRNYPGWPYPVIRSFREVTPASLVSASS